MGSAIKTFIAYQLSIFFAETINSAMDMVEVVNLFNVSLGQLSEETNRALVELSAISGLDLTNLREATGTYALLARSMGFANDQASVLALNTTKLALDLSSLMNVPIKQVYADLRSGLLGQTETVYKYGVDLTEASLQQTAFDLGLQKSVRTMTQGEKMWLRYETLIRQTTLAQGDLARTLETPANQMRILGERITTLGRAIGNVLLKALAGVLPYLNAFVTILTSFFQLIGRLIGAELPKIEDTVNTGGTGISGIGDEAEGSADKVKELNKELKDTVLGFDELHTIQKASPQDSSSGGGGAGLPDGDINKVLSEYDNRLKNIKTLVDDIVDSFYEWLGLTRDINEETGEIEFNLIEGGFADKLKQAIEDEDWFEVGRLIGSKLTEAVAKLNEFISWDNISNSVRNAVNTISGLINGFFAGFGWDVLGQTIGNGLNSAIYTGILLLNSINFVSIGQSIAETLNNAISTIDWTALGYLISSGVNSAFDFFLGLLKDFDFIKFGISLGEALMGAIRNTDFTQVGTTLATGLTGIVDTVAGFINTLDTQTIIEAVINFASGFFETINQWIVEKIQTDDGASILGAIGTFIGLIAAGIPTLIGTLVGGLASSLITFIGTAIGELLPTFGETASSMLSYFASAIDSLDKGELLQAGINILAGIIQGFVSAFVLIGEAILKFFNWIIDGIKNAFGIHSPAEKTKPLGENILLGIVEGFKSKFQDFTNAINSWFEEKVKPWFTIEKWSELWENVKSAFSQKWDEILTWWQDTAIYKFIEEKLKPKFTKEYWLDLLKGAKEAVKESFKAGFNGAIEMVERAVNWIIEKINTLHWTVPDWVPAIGGSEWGFDFDPISIPRLARGGMLQGGQLFVAGEYGKTEMVGNYNGKTTVMPLENTDFVKAMYDAVYSAVIQGQSGGTQNIENILYLDGEVVYKSYNKTSKKKGVNFNLGEFAR